MRILLTGAGGLLAVAVARELAAIAAVSALDHRTLDITDGEAVARTVADTRPDVIVNCAAYNDVDAAERDAVAALRVNAFAVASLAGAAGSAGAVLVHYSTDFVFDGSADRPYREDDRPNPRGVYGMSKLLGEWFALEHANAFVLRVESLFGEPASGRTRRGSLGTIIDRIRAGEPVPVFVDRPVSPSYTVDVARATRELLMSGATPGIYHCVNGGAATWAEIAVEIARALDRPPETRAITLESARLEAPRPKYCALSNAKLAAAGVTMPAWQDALKRYLSRVAS